MAPTHHRWCAEAFLLLFLSDALANFLFLFIFSELFLLLALNKAKSESIEQSPWKKKENHYLLTNKSMSHVWEDTYPLAVKSGSPSFILSPPRFSSVSSVAKECEATFFPWLKLTAKYFFQKTFSLTVAFLFFFLKNEGNEWSIFSFEAAVKHFWRCIVGTWSDNCFHIWCQTLQKNFARYTNVKVSCEIVGWNEKNVNSSEV